MALISYFGDPLEKEDHQAAIRWLRKNKKRLLECQDFIEKSPFKDVLEASFHMWNSDSKYWSEDLFCVVRPHGIVLEAEGQGDISEGQRNVHHIGVVTFL